MDERKRPHLVVMDADPPWQFDDKLGKRGASAHYDPMTVRQIETMALPRSFTEAANAVLFLWCMEQMQLEAIRVCLAWRVHPYNSHVWNKKNADGSPALSMGYITRGAHERCIVAVRGEYKGGYEPAVHDVPSSFDACPPRDLDGKRIHSAKPDEHYERVERLYPHADSYHMMFSRRSRSRWLCYGNETGKLDGQVRHG